MKKNILAITALAVALAASCGGKGGTPKTRGSNTADTLLADTAAIAAVSEDNIGSAQDAALEIISRDYKYEKSNIEFNVHLENIGNSDKIYNLINKLMYNGKNFDEYMKYTEKDFVEDFDVEGWKWEVRKQYDIVCNSGTHIIFSYFSYEYLGGAHGSHWMEYYTIDLIEERVLDISDLMHPVPDSLLDRIIKSDYGIADDDDSYYHRENIWPPDAVNFCDKNIQLSWNPLHITFSPVNIEIQDSVITRYLTDKGKSLRTKPMVNRPKTPAAP